MRADQKYLHRNSCISSILQALQNFHKCYVYRSLNYACVWESWTWVTLPGLIFQVLSLSWLENQQIVGAVTEKLAQPVTLGPIKTSCVDKSTLTEPCSLEAFISESNLGRKTSHTLRTKTQPTCKQALIKGSKF